jgi:subtilisin family serine protease
MASPVVAGVAAFLASYYPNLTPQQIKQVIEASAVKPAEKVRRPGEGPVELSDLSKTGGIVNAYEAAVMAEKISSGKPVAGAVTTQKKEAPKPKKEVAKKPF